MKRFVLVLSFFVLLAPTLQAVAADDSKVKAATNQVESGAKKIGDCKVGDGVEQTAKGVGNTVVEGAKYSGEKLKESGKAHDFLAGQSCSQGIELAFLLVLAQGHDPRACQNPTRRDSSEALGEQGMHDFPGKGIAPKLADRPLQ